MEPGLAKVEATAGTLIAYATAPDEVALDGTGPNSPFTAALVEYVGEPGLEVRQVLTRVRGRVMKATNGRQVPWDSSSLTGDFYFRSREIEPPAPAPPSVDTKAMELAFWQSIQTSDDPADFEAYLTQFPNGIYAALARNRLVRLKASQQAALPPTTKTPPPPAAAEPVPKQPLPSEPAKTQQQAALPPATKTPPPPAGPVQPPAAPAASPEVIEAVLGLSREDWRRFRSRSQPSASIPGAWTAGRGRTRAKRSRLGRQQAAGGDGISHQPAARPDPERGAAQAGGSAAGSCRRRKLLSRLRPRVDETSRKPIRRGRPRSASFARPPSRATPRRRPASV